MISVIIPVYNRIELLNKALASIFAQTYKDIEVIVVDDGSSEKLQIQNYKFQNNVQVRLFKQENMGAPVARNRGLAEAKGEYVIFWDADTIGRPKMLEKMLFALEQNPKASYAYSRYYFGWKKMKSHTFDPILLQKINYIDQTSLVRRTDLPAEGCDASLKRFQDWDLWLTMLENKKTGVLAPEVLYKKIVRGRKGISSWLPGFVFKLPWKIKKVKEYEKAREIILKKHGLKNPAH